MKRTPGKTAAARERYWTKIIVQAREYPGGVKAYCADKQISVNSYYGWFGKLRAEHPEWKDLDHPLKSRNGDSHEVPETEVVERATRRTFTAAYKTKILREVEAAPAGMVATILRREGLYSSHLQKWRAEDHRANEARKRGPKVNPLAPEVAKLRAQIAKLEKRLNQAEHIIDLQKKIAEIMGVTLEQIPDDE
ncbi:MAG: transposase [Blastocatellia bacterium]